MDGPVALSIPTPRSGTPAAFGRRAVVWAIVNVGIALLLSQVAQQRFWTTLCYSESIGLSCLLLIDSGRVLAARVRRSLGARPFADPDWPGWPAMALCAAVGVPGGYLLGYLIADLATGHVPLQAAGDPGNIVTLMLVSLGCAVAGMWSGRGRARLLLARGEAEAARRIAAESELRLLQAQLEPHMLFNTLANLRALITLDPPGAGQMLDRLNAFLRAVLNAGRQPAHSLGAEFRCLDDYLALIAIRMGQRLSYQVTLPAALEAIQVPPLLLQPLVENAIRHGLEPKVGRGRVEVAAEQQGDRIALTVRDDGDGISAPSGSGGGVGLRLVRERLAARYGGQAAFTLTGVPGSEAGTTARIELPIERSTG